MIVVTGANGVLGRGVVEELLDLVGPERVGVSVRDPDAAGRPRRPRRARAPRRLRRARHPGRRVRGRRAGARRQREHPRRRRPWPSTGPRSRPRSRPAPAASSTPPTRVRVPTRRSPRRPTTPRPRRCSPRAASPGRRCATASTRTPCRCSSPTPRPPASCASPRTARSRGPPATTSRPRPPACSSTGAPDGPTAPLTGPEAVDFEQVARIVGDLVGRPVRRVVVEPDEYRETLIGRGVPAHAADLLLGFFPAARRGDFAPADPTLAGLIGRPATPIADVLRAALSPAPASS